MKYSVIFSVIIALLFCFSPEVQAQIKNPVKKAKEEGVDRTNRGVDNVIDKGYDKLEEGIGNLLKKKKDKKAEDGEGPEEDAGSGRQDESGTAGRKKADPVLSWSKYDFVPGDKVIYEDNLIGEENGEFPSRWDLFDGSVEIAVLDGENVIMFREYGSTIVPYMKDPESDYLPDIFTVEFDAFIPHDHIQVYLFDDKNQNAPAGHKQLYIMGYGMELSPASSDLPGGENLENSWIHVAIAYTSGKLKAYINETRLINIPRLSYDPTGISIRALHAGEESHYYIKNIRIAEGGVKYYDRFMQDGKIIANGIRFDVNKATLKPESMGVINEIATLMKEHPEVSFSVEGHTDSDGDGSFNQTLSEQRAGTVVEALKSLGIDGSRMTSKGWGESKPLDTNATAEGKANNRRVEFVKV
ncbi:MAG: OmpA family protein [Bacteroidales bacterium]|jgi:outer membrane protein OmpA-like peptidoglycan-associated protein|nr:OmpA family protein [Bacteroidales bacterium]MCB9028559.1 OmpA family protein [Bacteroidales bacterium]NLD62289.1 OmpA family protein [Bacteroidales bacterium]HOO67068.1 OmpA family protein [Bacteroidales bacterium]HPE23326.1 OmpA family protein [Bacteroidales bacterium]